VLDRASFAPRNADMEARYKAGTVGVQEFADFYVGTLAGRTLRSGSRCASSFWPRDRAAHSAGRHCDLVVQHLDAGDLVVLTTATNRFITELTALYLGIEHLMATDRRWQATAPSPATRRAR
jgi:phosphoserine phosphatase